MHSNSLPARSVITAVVAVVSLFAAAPLWAQEQSAAQQACINAVNKGFAKVAKAQRKEIAGCIKRGVKGKLAGGETIDSCMVADEKGKVAKAGQKTLDQELVRCTEPPDFAYSSGPTASTQSAAAELALVRSLFGSDLDGVIRDAASDDAGASCQQAVAKLAGKCQDAFIKDYNKCKKRVLKGGKGVAPATAVGEVAACEGEDGSGKVAKTCQTKLADGVAARCSGQDVAALVPGCATEELAACAAARVAAHAGVALDAADALTPIRTLVFSRTAGFRHASIADAHVMLGNLPEQEGIRTLITEDPSIFSDAGLAPFDVLLFANTTGDILDDGQQAAMQAFIRSGRGYVGAHSAADTEHTWPWYGQLVGAYFRSHPLLPVEVEVTTEDPLHPSTDHLPETFLFTDEIYNLDRNPRLDSSILLTIDEAGFIYPNFPAGPSMGEDHPIAWHRQFDGGRSFYTNLGHRPASWQDPLFQEHLLEGIRWAAEGVSYSRIVVSDEGANPLALAVTPAGEVYYVERTGEVLRWSPQTGRVDLAAIIIVDTSSENGLLGIAIDPDFSTSRHVYLYHSEPVPIPPPATGPPGENVLSRFTALGDGTLDMASRVDLLRVPSERLCCHEAGSLAFGADGTLFLSTGDNTNPFLAAGYAPLDERAGHEQENSQRTSANPFDLRGKILRINPDGTIPIGNLFPATGELGLPEIFAMGTRNPFRVAVDPVSGRLFWGEVGPDAFGDGPRGPRGYDEINFADVPGNYGWPYCIADNLAYADYDYDTEIAGPLFDCTGNVPATLSYDYDTLTERALGTAFTNTELGGFTGRTAIAGTFYRSPAPDAPFALPPPFADTLLMTEWTRDIVAAVEISVMGELGAVTRFAPWERFIRPIDLEIGPDGALYVLEYGSGFGGDNTDARLSRVEHSTTGELSPVAAIVATMVEGQPDTFEFSSAGSHVPGRADAVAAYEWDFDGDGIVDSPDPTVTHTFTSTGLFPVSLTVVATSGRRSIPVVHPVVIGNTAPQVTIDSPVDGVTVPSGTIVTVSASAFDAEDGVVDCADFAWERRLGHNAHSHPAFTPQGDCMTSFTSTLPDHGDGLGLFWTVELSVTDGGGPGGEPALTGRASIRINVSP